MAKTNAKPAAAPKQSKDTIAEGNRLATTKPAALAVSAPEDIDFVDEAGHGFGAADLAIPRIGLLQSGSPQVKKGEGKQIKGAEEGDFLENVSNSIIGKSDTGIRLVPVAYRHTFIEWIPKDSGGGFVADHGNTPAVLQHCQKTDDGKFMLKNGHEIVETAEYYVLAFGEDEVARQAVISLAKSQWKAAKAMNSAIELLRVSTPSGSRRPKMYYSTFRANSIPDTNKKGQSWMRWNIVREGNTIDVLGRSVYEDARAFCESVTSGAVRVAEPIADETTVSGSPDDGATL